MGRSECVLQVGGVRIVGADCMDESQYFLVLAGLAESEGAGRCGEASSLSPLYALARFSRPRSNEPTLFEV